MTCLATAVWGAVTFFDPARSSRPARTFWFGAGASAVAYFAWLVVVAVPAIGRAARASQAYWLLPQPKAPGAPPFLAAWPLCVPMGVATLCLLVRGALAFRDVRRQPVATRSPADADSPEGSLQSSDRH